MGGPQALRGLVMEGGTHKKVGNLRSVPAAFCFLAQYVVLLPHVLFTCQPNGTT